MALLSIFSSSLTITLFAHQQFVAFEGHRVSLFFQRSFPLFRVVRYIKLVDPHLLVPPRGHHYRHHDLASFDAEQATFSLDFEALLLFIFDGLLFGCLFQAQDYLFAVRANE